MRFFIRLLCASWYAFGYALGYVLGYALGYVLGNALGYVLSYPFRHSLCTLLSLSIMIDYLTVTAASAGKS